MCVCLILTTHSLWDRFQVEFVRGGSMPNPSVLVFACGSAEGRGSGFENLVHTSRKGILHANIVAVVSNHEFGVVRTHAKGLGIPFIHFPGPYDAESYARLFAETKADFAALSGWLKKVKGLESATTINIHPAPLPEFGGRRMYGHHVHEAVMDAYQRGEITHSAVCMHFVTEKYDDGPVFFRYNVKIQPNDTAETLAARVNKVEHLWQPYITSMVVNRQITWSGKRGELPQFPALYEVLHSVG